MATRSIAIDDDLEFIQKIEPLLSEKQLEKADLQVYVKVEDVNVVCDFIGRDWYKFGESMNVDNDTLDYIKENNKSRQEKKADLLQYLIKQDKIRYEEIVYGHYKLDHNSSFIAKVLDFLVKERGKQEAHFKRVIPDKPHLKRQTSRSQRLRSRSLPWQAFYSKRLQTPVLSSRRKLSIDHYQEQFYNMLWFEETEHMKKLKTKCDGQYNLYIYSGDEVPSCLKDTRDTWLHPDSEYGYIQGDHFTDDQIEYATQASEGVHIYSEDDVFICKARISDYNYVHVEQCLYVCLPPSTHRKLSGRTPCINGYYSINFKFEVKHSYFNNLQHAVVNLPPYVVNCLLPNEESFSKLNMTFKPQWSSFNFMKLDTDRQLSALRMITSVPSKSTITSCPPVILYGPFGSGKTRILARAAYEIMMNGITTGVSTKILICAHHPQSINTFITDYFARIEFFSNEKLPFNVVHVSNQSSFRPQSNFYKTVDELAKSIDDYQENVIIIASYNTSLRLYDLFHVPDYGFFTHLFLDEAAQVREPEAITPLALATREAKIILAGDDKQVGPRTLVLGDAAKECGLDVSLLKRLMERYKKMGPIAEAYVTSLTINYRSHEQLLALPELFYGKLDPSEHKPFWHHRGPAGYRFVCSDSRLVPDYIDKDQPLVEACIVLEQVLEYLKTMEGEKRQKICIIASTRKQLNHIKRMASRYPCYSPLKKQNVSFLPSFMIQGHEFQAIFLSLLEPLKEDIKNYFTKSLFNSFVFNTVITRAKSLVVAVGKPRELLDFEDNVIGTTDKVKCWHEYMCLCIKRESLFNLQPEIQSEVMARLGLKVENVSLKHDFLPVLEPMNTTTCTSSHQFQVVPSDKTSISQPEVTVSEQTFVDNTTTKLDIKQPQYPVMETVEKRSEVKGKMQKDEKLEKDEELTYKFEKLQRDYEGLKQEYSTLKKMSRQKDRQISRLSRSSLESPEKEKDITLNKQDSSFQADVFLGIDDEDAKDVSTKKKRKRPKHSQKPKHTEQNNKSTQTKTAKTALHVSSQTQEFTKTSTSTPIPEPLSERPIVGLLAFFIILLSHLNSRTTYLASFPGVEVLASKRFLVAGGQLNQVLHWEQYGLRLSIPHGSLPPGILAEIVIRVSVSGPYVYPYSESWKPASAIYWISSSKDFLNPIQLGIWHNVRGKTNSSHLRVVTAHDEPHNMKYFFRDVPAFNINESYVYLSLLHFSGYSTLSTEDTFQGALLYQKSPKGTNIWDYSFIVYKCYTSGVISRLLATSQYIGWTYDINELDVVFENNSESLELTPKQLDSTSKNWRIIEKNSPLMYHRSQLRDSDKIISNMQFMLHWSGAGSPTVASTEFFALSLQGAKQPKVVTIVSNSVNDADGNTVSGANGGIIPRDDKLFHHTSSVSDFSVFCYYLSIGDSTCSKIKKDEIGIEDQKIAALTKWQDLGKRTWKDFITVLARTKQCRQSKNLAKEHNVYFESSDKEDSDILSICPTINDI